jgi:hypothetical protein
MDPTDQVDYLARFDGPAPVLEADETIASYTVELMPEAAGAGLIVSQGGGRDPALVDGKAISLWFEVDVAKRESGIFAKGIAAGVVFTIITTAIPARRRQRTFVLTVAQL